MKSGITTDVGETTSQLRKDSQLKISVLMQRLFLLDARPVYSAKKLRPLLIPNSKSSVDTSSICILKNGRNAPFTSASLNEVLRLLQLITCPNLVRG